MFATNKTYTVIFFSAFLGILFAIPTSMVLADNSAPPKITSVSPSAINQGDIVEVVGENFGSVNVGSVVTPGNQNLSVITWTETKITVVANIHNENDWALIVRTDENDDGAYLYSNSFPIKKLQRAPKIISITPNKIKPLGTAIEIVGENFGAAQTTYGGKLYDGHHIQGAHEILSWSDTRITAIINLVERDWLHYQPVTDLQVRVKCIDTVCKNGGQEFTNRPADEYWSNQFGIKLDVPTCTESEWSCSEWSACSITGKQTRECTRTFLCGNADSQTPPATAQSCIYTPPCNVDTWNCREWSVCSLDGKQSRSCNKIFDCPTATTPSPQISQSCFPLQPACTADNWLCGNWNACTANGTQSRSCAKSFDCSSVETPSPATTQVCTPPQPACNADTWTCGGWGICSLSGIQSRSCTKIVDCPNVETAPPTTDQFCDAPNKSTQQALPESPEEITNQDAIIKSTVKLICLVDARRASQGSGTIINPNGTILTNKHVIAGTLGCRVGFINNFDDEPYFGASHIADIVKISPNQDIAVLRIRNPQNKILPSVNIGKGGGNLRLGTKITTYGFPAKFGTKVTYTSGDFSGTDGSFLKTTAILEYGNSGGGAYLKDGTFIGVPSAVVKGELNALGYILSISTINAWLGNSNIISGGTTNNQYSRVSALEDIKPNDLGSLKLFIPQTDASGNLSASATNQQKQKDTPQIQPTQTQEESTVIESSDTKQNRADIQNEEPKKMLWVKKLFSWLSNLFAKMAR